MRCLFEGEKPEGGVEPLTRVPGFDVSEQISFNGFPSRVSPLMDAFRFQAAEEA